MKAILWRFKYLIAALAVFAGLSVPALASASTAVSALPADTTSHPWINDHTGGEQAFVTGSGMNMQDSVNETLDFLWQGTVDNGDNGNCWPFTCGNGLNTYYNNLPVYEVTEANGYLPCATATEESTGYAAKYTTTACGGGHLYSLFVEHSPWDGKSGSTSWANVGATNTTGVGEYMNSAQKGDFDNFSINCGTSCSYHL